MRIKFEIWNGIFWNADGGAGAGGGAGNGGAASGAAGGGAGDPNGGQGGAGSGQEAPQSLFSQIAGHFEDPKEKEGFENWSKKYASDKDRAKAFNSMRTSFDQRVALPGEASTPEDWSKFYQKLGKPATSKEYTFNWGNRQASDEETARLEGFKEVAHKFDLTQRQLEGLVAWNNQNEDQMSQAAIDQMDAFQDKTVEFLKKEWRADFESNQQYVRAVGVQFASDQKEWRGITDMKILGAKGEMRGGTHA